MSDLIEKKVKRNWLYVLFICNGLGIIMNAISLLRHDNLQIYMNPNLLTIIHIFLMISPLIWAYIYYRCAYKKPGRKFLAFNLILTPFSLIYSIVFILLQRFNLLPFFPKHQMVYSFYNIITIVIALIASVIFFVLSIKLFKLNKIIQNRLAIVSKD